jgi:hypothetical protein
LQSDTTFHCHFQVAHKLNNSSTHRQLCQFTSITQYQQ